MIEHLLYPIYKRTLCEEILIINEDGIVEINIILRILRLENTEIREY